jgi:aldehyde:ferredoxin oxidoreductase
LTRLFRIGERIWNLEHAFNIREGFSRKDDCLPGRFLTEPLDQGPVKGAVVELDRLLDDYYDQRGWGRTNGYPTRETLERLDLKSVANDLEGMGILG